MYQTKPLMFKTQLEMSLLSKTEKNTTYSSYHL